MGKLFVTMVMAIVVAVFVIYLLIKLFKGNKETINTIKKSVLEDDSNKYNKLQELAKLRDQKIISEDEFLEQKKKILKD